MKLTLLLLLAVPLLCAQPNTLSPAEKAEGWVLLFGGKTLAGWDQGAATTWRAENGTLIADSGEPLNLRST